MSMNRAERHALLTSVLVPINLAAAWLEAPLWILMMLWLICPIAFLWLVRVVLRDTTTLTEDLVPGHEWDHLDRPDLAKRDTRSTPSPEP